MLYLRMFWSIQVFFIYYTSSAKWFNINCVILIISTHWHLNKNETADSGSVVSVGLEENNVAKVNPQFWNCIHSLLDYSPCLPVSRPGHWRKASSMLTLSCNQEWHIFKIYNYVDLHDYLALWMCSYAGTHPCVWLVLIIAWIGFAWILCLTIYEKLVSQYLYQ